MQQSIPRAYEGTAIAIALGAAALPDNKRYAITANVGTFRGESAFGGSAQLRVSDNLVLNAGIGAASVREGSARGLARPGRGEIEAGPQASHPRSPPRGRSGAGRRCGAAVEACPHRPERRPDPGAFDLIALDQANKTGNYTVLRDLGSPAFQANTAARLGEIFAGLRHEILRSLGRRGPRSGTDTFAADRRRRHDADDGLLSLGAGADQFRSRLCAGQRTWRLFAITVRLGQTAPAAPAAPAPAEKPEGNLRRRRTTGSDARAGRSLRPASTV